MLRKALLLVAAGLALTAAVDVKDAAKVVPPAPVPPAPVPPIATDAAKNAAKPLISAEQSKRTLVVSGRALHSIWLNMTEVYAAITPIVKMEGAAANATVIGSGEDLNRIPDEHAKSQAHAIFDQVMAVLNKFKATDISTPASFVSSPVFAPNATAFKMLMAHQNQRLEKQRMIMAERWGKSRLVMGHPLQMGEMHGPMRVHRSRLQDMKKEQIKPEADKKEQDKKEGEQKPEDKDLPLPDPKTLVNFQGFRFYQPLRFVVPTAVIPELSHALRGVNTTVIGIKAFVPQPILDSARNVATSEAVRNALKVADSAFSAAGVSRVSIDNILVRTSPQPDFPLRMVSTFIPPQNYVVRSTVVLSASF